MADMTMCDRPDCPSRDTCLRATAEPDPEAQSYFAPPYDEIVGGKCMHYIGPGGQGKKRPHREKWDFCNVTDEELAEIRDTIGALFNEHPRGEGK